MKKIGIILLLVGAVTVGYYFYNQVNLAKKFSYQILGVRPTQVSGSNVSLLIGFLLTNQSNFSAHLKNVEIIVYLDNVISGTITNHYDIIIPARGTASIQVNLNIFPKQLESNAVNILSTLVSGKTMNVDFVGKMDIQTMLFPISVPIRYSTTGKNLVSLYQENFS